MRALATRAPPRQHNSFATRIEAMIPIWTRRASEPYHLLRYPSAYDEAPALPGVLAPFGGAGLYHDRVGARGESWGSETQAAVRPAVLKRPYRLPIEVHEYV